MKWRTTMPRQLPEEGKANFVLAIRTSTGARLESISVISERLAELMFSEVRERIDSSNDPNTAVARLIEQMKELGLWDEERHCPKGCVDPTKWSSPEIYHG